MENQTVIKVLPPELINQIAAGEVVERPASVVKELVENSLDAKAANITIELENGGMNLIKITDDGAGMCAADARLSIVQHATSKINSPDDLFNINSLGFRGEALASIASVSDFCLITRQTDDLAGHQISVVNNKIEYNQVGCAKGACVIVKKLFENIPARRKYLKTAVTEYNHIVDLFLNYVLAYGQVGWRLINNGRTVYQFSAVPDIKNRILEVLGMEIADNLLSVEYNGVELKITGFIGKPQIARNNKKLQFLFINQRPVNEYVAAKQIKDAYAAMLPRDRFPVYLLYIQIDPKKVDVNVHPRKSEVRFADPSMVYRTIYRAVGDALDRAELTKTMREYDVPVMVSPANSANLPASMFSAGQFKTKPSFHYPPAARRQVDLPVQPLIHNQPPMDLKQESVLPAVEQPEMILGQLHASYIIVQTAGGLKIYDQHAVSEQIQYQKIKQSWLADKITKQQLLLPITLDLPAIEANMVRLNMPMFSKLGFELAELSNNSFMINSVPQELMNKDIPSVIKEILAQMGEWELGQVQDCLRGLTAPVDRVLKMMSCRSAVKFGDKLSREELQAMLNNLAHCDNQYTCVHGRPCVIQYSLEELEKLFNRRN